MPSALPSSPGLLSRMVGVLGGKLGGKDTPQNSFDRIKRLGMSQRQQRLNRLWAVYRCAQYENRKVDWNGKESVDELSEEVISTQGFVPPGFIDQSRAGNPLPLKFRRPTAPYALIKMIVDRFSGLLFSENQHPEIKVDGDPTTEDWLRTVADAARLWQQMILARQYGGSMGTAVVGFQFLDGKPVVEIHDPRWMTPTFTEQGSTVLESVEKRYIFPKEERDDATGKWETKDYWYRRVIDQQSDILFEPALVEQGDEPEWVEAKHVDHNFGFCPIIWAQNLPVQDSEDGDPDCDGYIYENVRTIDALIAQANRAILANCDPQLVLTTKAEMADVKLGGDSALRVPDGDAKFLEVQATGPKAALDLAEQLRKHVLEMASCVLEHPDVAGKTATEVERMYQAMLAKADVLREQYGQKCILPLLEMMYRGAVMLSKPRALAPVNPDLSQAAPDATVALPPTQAQPQLGEGPGTQASTGGQSSGLPPPSDGAMDGIVTPLQMQRPTVVRGTVTLPPRYEAGPDGTKQPVERVPGNGGTFTLKWPGYFQPTLNDVQLAATAASAAMTGGLIDDETAVGFVAPYFKVEDKAKLVDKVRQNAAKQQMDMMTMMASSNEAQGGAPPGGGAGTGGGGGEQEHPSGAPAGLGGAVTGG